MNSDSIATPLGPRPEVGGGSWFRLLRKGSKRLACGLAYGLRTGERGDGRSQGGASIPRRVWLPVPAFPPESCWRAGWLSFGASLVALPLLAGEASAVNVELKVASSSSSETDHNSIILEDEGTLNLAVTAYGLRVHPVSKRTTTPLTINYTLGGTATPGVDYTIGFDPLAVLNYAAGTGAVAIPQDTETMGPEKKVTLNLPITIINDADIDSGETIIVTLQESGLYDLTPSKEAVTLTTYEASTLSVFFITPETITDVDYVDGVGTLQEDKAASPFLTVETFEHGGRIQDAFIGLTETLSEDLMIRYTLGGTATPGVDYTIRGINYTTGIGTIKIPAGTLAYEPVPLPLEILNDDVSDDGERIIVTIMNPKDYSYIPDNRSLAVDIEELAGHALAAPVVSWGTTNAFAVEDQGTQTVGIQVNQPLAADLTINYTLRGTATPGVDYTIAGANPMTRMGTFTIPAGTPAATSVDFPIAILNDGVSDDGETILLTIASGSGYNLGSEFLTMKIQESGGPATVSWNGMGGNTLTLLRDGATHNLPLVVSQPLSADLTIHYTLTGTATQGEDYTIAGADRDEEGMFTGTGTFTIPAGTPRSVNVDFPIHIPLEYTYEGEISPDEIILLTLEKGSGYEVANGLFRLTITEHRGGSGIFRIRGTPYLNETLMLPHNIPALPPGHTLTVTTAALYPDGFICRNERLNNRNASQVSALEVPLTPNGICGFGNNPTTMGRLLGSYIFFEIRYYDQNELDTGTLLRTEWFGPVQPMEVSKASFSTATASVNENMGTHQVVVDLNPAPTSAFTLDYTVSGTATAGAGNDFTIPDSGTVQVPAGALSVSIPVSIVKDTVEEGSETVVLTLEPGDDYVLSNPTHTHTVTLTDAEEVSWGTTTLSAVEGGGTQTMGIQVNQPLSADLTISYTLQGTATPGEDYTIAGANYRTGSGTFTIPSGTPPFTRVDFPIAILNDSVQENDETIILTITSSPNYDTGNLYRATVTICEQACQDNNDGSGDDDPTMEPVAEPVAFFALPVASLEESMGPHQVTINLNPAPTLPLILNYTVGGTATAGAGNDFTIPNSGMAPVAAGAASVTIPVTIIDDNTPELDETVVLTLAAGTGYGLGTPNTPHTLTITDTDTEEKTDHKRVKKAWHLRFGRTLSHQVADGLQDRLSAPPTALGLQLTVAGETITSPTPLAEQEGLLSKALGFEAVTPQTLVEGSSFSLASGQGPGGTRPQLAFWGHGAFSSFSGEEDELSLDGDVTTVLLGADWTTDQWRAGAALSQSWGSGSYEDDNDAEGEISNTVTGVFPYGRYALTPRLGLWATAGYGWGTLSFQPDGEDEYTPGTTMVMAAVGMDGVLRDGGDEGITLSSTADVLTMNTSSEDVDGLDSSEGSVSRLRLGIEAARPFPLSSGASLLPSMEVGIRQDSGDAETGFGLDLGVGLAWSDPQHGISSALKGHTLLAHGEDDFQEQGLAFSFSWSTPSNRGPSLSLNHTMGAAPSRGMDALLNPATMEGLEATPSHGQQFEAELAYGLPAYNDHLSFTPALALALSPTSRNYSVLWSLAPYAQQAQADPWEISLEGERQERNTATSPVEHSLKLRFSTLF